MKESITYFLIICLCKMENHELGVNTNRMLWIDEYFGTNVAD